MKKNMETTIMGYMGIIGYILGFLGFTVSVYQSKQVSGDSFLI